VGKASWRQVRWGKAYEKQDEVELGGVSGGTGALHRAQVRMRLWRGAAPPQEGTLSITLSMRKLRVRVYPRSDDAAVGTKSACHRASLRTAPHPHQHAPERTCTH
jgi:hypothetical protein